MRTLPLFFFLFFFASANAQIFDWAKQFGGAGDSFGNDVVTDASGNVYTVGYLTGVIDLDPGPGVFNLGQPTGGGVYISKLDKDGNFVWAKQFVGWNLAGYAIALDGAGNVITTGFFQQYADFDPGPGVYNLFAPTGSHAFICKLDNDGNFIWADQFGTSPQSCISYDLKVDAAGNIISTGYFTGIVDFDPGPGIYNMSAWGAGADAQCFVIKVNASGSLVWAKQFENMIDPGGGVGLGVASDNNGAVYTTGVFTGTVDFDPGPGNYNLTNPMMGKPSFFISKLDGAGNFIWAKQVAGATQGQSASIIIDNSGNVFVAGNFGGTADFDPGPLTSNMTSAGGTDAFMMKLTGAGSLAWATQFGGTGNDEGKRISRDAADSIYLTGYFQNTVDFDPGPVSVPLTSFGSYDCFIAKFDNNGKLDWAKQVGGSGNDQCYSARPDALGNVYATGRFSVTADFDPGPDVYNMTSIGSGDAFVLKLRRCNNITTSTITTTACNSYILNGKTYTSSGTYKQTLRNAEGCDSIITLNLTIGGAASNWALTVCNSYVWEGTNYTATGLYTKKFPAADGCDSIVTLDLIVKNSITKTINASICEGQSYAGYTTSGIYTNTFLAANGCDSIRTLNLTVSPKISTVVTTTICNGQQYAGYTTSGTYTDTYTSAGGCDSIRTLNLTVTSNINTLVNATICNGQQYAGHTTSGTYTDTYTSAGGCDSLRTLNLTVVSNINTIVNAAICSGQQYAGHTTSGTYTDTYTSAGGCDSTRTLNLTVSPSINTVINAAICSGQQYAGYTTSGTFTDKFVSTGGCDSIRTLNLTISPNINTVISASICPGEQYNGYSVPGTYIDTYTSTGGCDSIRTLNLTVGAAKKTTNNASICEGESYFAAGAAQTLAGIYSDTLQANFGCDSIIETILVVNAKPKPALGTDRNLCDGTSLLLIPGTFKSYVWQDMSTASSFSAINTGLYWVTVTDNNNCTATDSILISAINPVPSDFLKNQDSICFGDKLMLQTTGDYSNYLWSTGSGQKYIEIQAAGEYWLKVTDTNGCTGNDTIQVYPKACNPAVFIPTAFTPDGDGKNDLFKAVVTARTVSFKLEVYDRAGQLIFRSTNPDQGWNGTYKGSYLTTAVFVWQCSYQLEGFQPAYQKGTLALIR